MALKFHPIHVEKQTNKIHSGLVIILHGLGGTGKDMQSALNSLMKKKLQYPHLQIFYPTAPVKKLPGFGKQNVNAWFEVNEYLILENQESIDNCCTDMVHVIKTEITKGIPLNRVIIGGFSMGAKLSINLAYRFMPELAGVFAMSGFIAKQSLVYKDLDSVGNKDNRKKIPLFIIHGDKDNIVPVAWGQYMYQRLIERGIKGEFHIMKNVSHKINAAEIGLLNEWILKNLPPLPTDK